MKKLVVIMTMRKNDEILAQPQEKFFELVVAQC